MPPNPQNLKPKPWPKGVSGNPKGRPPKGAAFADLIALIDETPGGRRALSKTWFKEMLKGNFRYFREYLERSDGKVASKVELTENKIDWSALDNEDDTARPSASAARLRSLPESGEA